MPPSVVVGLQFSFDMKPCTQNGLSTGTGRASFGMHAKRRDAVWLA
ncbi:hypothetical protein RSSM_06244 [Rhodopirellula sallentina SM41]|uniref:Uncharacterized protein n=1 Tax=Rhodopirellula sallentina SM41 TaxID=1263870 RepID=M5TSY6_9BACT|nr:hypothetical protein RSSM_06244 [Rhodopirellula sallentina SM41]